jgi:hypothetical protein
MRILLGWGVDLSSIRFLMKSTNYHTKRERLLSVADVQLCVIPASEVRGSEECMNNSLDGL